MRVEENSQQFRCKYSLGQNVFFFFFSQLKKHGLTKQGTENTSANSKDLLRRALCSGYFCNVARKWAIFELILVYLMEARICDLPLAFIRSRTESHLFHLDACTVSTRWSIWFIFDVLTYFCWFSKLLSQSKSQQSHVQLFWHFLVGFPNFSANQRAKRACTI